MLGKGADSLLFNDFKNQTKEYSNYQIKSKDLLNQTQNNDLLNQTLKNKSQSADYLIEYFHGMILNYISLYESQGKKVDNLKNFIINYNKNNNKIEGGGKDEYLKYKNDGVVSGTTKYKNINWNKLSIKIDVNLSSKYEIIIKHDIDGNDENNKIYLIIDLYNNIIVDEIRKTCNSGICEKTNNINIQLKNIIKRLIYSEYNNKHYGLNIKIDGESKLYKDDYDYTTLYDSIISLLIIIFTLRKDVSKKIYKKYNTTLLLSGICKHGLINKYLYGLYENSIYIFLGNNNKLLTYSTENKNIPLFNGDCALNVLMCVKKADIRKLFVDKITLSQNKQNDLPKKSKYYFNKINDVLNNMKTLKDIDDYKELIKNYVKDYYYFTNFIIDKDYNKFIEKIDNPNKLNKSQIIFEYYKIYINVFKNNLLDYNLTDDDLKIIYNDLDKYYNEIEIIFKEANPDYEKISEKNDKLIGYIKEYFEKSFNIFYINVLISLLLTKHKINYLFDDNIMNVLKYSNDKEKIIKCFKNVCGNSNELDFYFPKYQKGNSENDKYLFMYVSVKGVSHATLSIFNINKTEKEHIYMYDLNDLIMYGSDNFEHNMCQSFNNITDEYPIKNNISNWVINKFTNLIAEWKKKENIIIEFHKIYKLKVKNHSLLELYIENSFTLNDIDIYSVFKNKYNNNLNFYKLLTFKYDDYNDNNFNFNKYIKRSIFNGLIKYITNFINNFTRTVTSPNISNLIFILGFNKLKESIETKIIDNEKCNMRNLLFIFIKYLIKCSLRINGIQVSDEELIKKYEIIIKECFDDTYHLDNEKFIECLNFKNTQGNQRLFMYIINNIKDILDTIGFKYDKTLIVRGGNVNLNYNNSLIKKILIVLLIIAIIIIVVLIVLFIINKYKNNKLKV